MTESGTACLLLVEDDDAVRAIMRELLEVLDYQVYEAIDASTALGHLESGARII